VGGETAHVILKTEIAEMVRFALATMILTVLIGSSAIAQDATPKVQVFGGYSFVHDDLGKLNGETLDIDLHQPTGTFGLNSTNTGWIGEAQYNLGPVLGLVADFGGRYGKPFTAVRGVTGLPNSNAYTIMLGPAFSYRTKSSITPFIHLLFGWDRTSLSASNINGPSSVVTSPAVNYTDFALAPGGGLDYKVSKHFSVRFVQVDWFHTSINFNKFYGSAYGAGAFFGLPTHQDNIRLSGGVEARF
jgi:opacity protein-like surface antigen